MTAVNWLQNLLYSIDPTITWIVLGYLTLGLLAIAACVRNSQLSRQFQDAMRWGTLQRNLYYNELDRQEAEANSAGPRMTARTLTEEATDED